MKYKGVWLSLLILVLWIGCASSDGVQKNAVSEQKMNDTARPTPAPNQEPRPYSKDLAELRAAFNRDNGKVGLVTLLSPT